MSEQNQSKRPEDKAFQQQRLRAWQPLLTPRWVIGTFLVVGVAFLAIGIPVYLASKNVVEVTAQYDSDNEANLLGKDGAAGANQTVSIRIPKDMNNPVYVYYKLTNFYQNHRRYVKSRSDPQLKGDNPSDLSSCDPLETWAFTDPNNATLNKRLYPCGLIANSMFNDTIMAPVITRGSNVFQLPADQYVKKGIAWSSDVDDKFHFNEKSFTDSAHSGDWLVGPQGYRPKNLVEDEDFIVWMRTAGLPTFKKLYRKITTDLKEGDVVTFNVAYNFPVRSFDGTKSIVLSTTSWLGGKNDFLGIAYIVVGVLCLVLGIAFAIKHHLYPRPLGDMRYFNWPGTAPKNRDQQ